MELSEIKSKVIGYSKKDVCRYISELNDLHEAEIQAQKDASDKTLKNYMSQIENITKTNGTLSETVKKLEAELSAIKQQLSDAQSENKELRSNYDAISKETEELRAKSEVISTAIINAEKCATTMIADADNRAKEMIDKAQGKVDDEVKRLETAKEYISEVRDAVEIALKKIDAELGGVENDITAKVQDVNSDSEKKASVKEKFETLFKRA